MEVFFHKFMLLELELLPESIAEKKTRGEDTVLLPSKSSITGDHDPIRPSLQLFLLV